MEQFHPVCPDCNAMVESVQVRCYSRVLSAYGAPFTVEGGETLFKCRPCAKIYFPDEVESVRFQQNAA
jgi:hypothetical protein